MNASLSNNFGRLRTPTIRPEAFDFYWIFAARRQAAFERRMAGNPPPWSDDPIIQTFKFCNVYRAADRVSQYMIRHVIYGNAKDNELDRIFRIVAFRTFSRPEAWRGVELLLGHPPGLDDLANGEFERALDAVKNRIGGLYTGAFILCATKAFGYDQKHKNHVALFKQMFLREQMGQRLLSARSLKDVVEILERFPLMGPFMSYQTAVDLNYSDLINFSEDSYTQAGPGALRGMRKAFLDSGDYTPSDLVHWMVDRQETEFQRLGLSFHGLWGRRLHAIDCQGLFCELDKYCREALPALASSRVRIKARFSPSSSGLRYFFPPKWGLNEKLAETCNALPGSADLLECP